MQLDYRKKRIQETFSGFPLEIECLEDLDQTIDDVFAWLEKTGTPELLEELCPYFGVIWPAARSLAEFVANHQADIQNRTVLELGCGLAIPGLIAAKLGARVTATDFHPEVPYFLKRNLELNRISDFKFVPLDWHSHAPELGKFDWVIGSDILYEKSHPAGVARAIASFAAPGGKIVITDPARPYLQAFVDEMGKLGFENHSRVKDEVFIIEFEKS